MSSEQTPFIRITETILNSKLSQIFYQREHSHTLQMFKNKKTNKLMFGAGASVAFKIWCRNQCMVGIICPPELERFG